MKLNVKGLVFVGFAAAILSANAMAATGDEKVVTSKAFTEATYQAKTAANKAGQVLKMGSATAGDIDYIAVDTTVANNSSNLVTSGAVYTAIAGEGVSGKQTKSTANFQVGGEDGAWNTIGTDSYIGVAAGTGDNANKAMFTINATTDSTIASANEAKLITAGAVKTYADNKIASSIGASDTTHAPSGQAVNNALALKQNASTAVKYDGTNAVGSATTPVYVDANGDVTASTYTIETSVPANAVFTDTTYDTLDAATVTTGTETTGKLVTAKVLRDELDNKVTKNNNITAGTATKITYDAKGLVTAGGSLLASDIPDISATYQVRQLGAAGEGGADSVDKDKLVYLGADGKIAKSGMKVTSSVAQNDTNPVTSGAVYSYVNGLSGSSIPDGSNCSAEAPCALVATGTNTFAWVPMSQPSNN